MSTDKSLERAIEKRILQDQTVSAFGLRIESLHGVVTLRGAVPNARAKLAAHELAASTPGCRSVINELEIAPAQGLADETIAAEVRREIDDQPQLTKGAIALHVDGGTVTLSGAVGSPAEYAMAEDLVRSVRGVRNVHNQLIIDRDAQYDDETLRLEIESALQSVEELREIEIKVAVSGDLVVLSGEVDDERKRALATEAVMGVRPWRLRNEITVTDRSQGQS